MGQSPYLSVGVIASLLLHAGLLALIYHFEPSGEIFESPQEIPLEVVFQEALVPPVAPNDLSEQKPPRDSTEVRDIADLSINAAQLPEETLPEQAGALEAEALPKPSIPEPPAKPVEPQVAEIEAEAQPELASIPEPEEPREAEARESEVEASVATEPLPEPEVSPELDVATTQPEISVEPEDPPALEPETPLEADVLNEPSGTAPVVEELPIPPSIPQPPIPRRKPQLASVPAKAPQEEPQREPEPEIAGSNEALQDQPPAEAGDAAEIPELVTKNARATAEPSAESDIPSPPQNAAELLANLANLQDEEAQVKRNPKLWAVIRQVRAQVARCWHIRPGKIKKMRNFTAAIQVSFAPDGALQNVYIQDSARMVRDERFKGFVLEARRALKSCSPFDLPSESYDIWRSFTMRFVPLRNG